MNTVSAVSNLWQAGSNWLHPAISSPATVATTGTSVGATLAGLLSGNPTSQSQEQTGSNDAGW